MKALIMFSTKVPKHFIGGKSLQQLILEKLDTKGKMNLNPLPHNIPQN